MQNDKIARQKKITWGCVFQQNYIMLKAFTVITILGISKLAYCMYSIQNDTQQLAQYTQLFQN